MPTTKRTRTPARKPAQKPEVAATLTPPPPPVEPELEVTPDAASFLMTHNELQQRWHDFLIHLAHNHRAPDFWVPYLEEVSESINLIPPAITWSSVDGVKRQAKLTKHLLTAFDLRSDEMFSQKYFVGIFNLLNKFLNDEAH